ncbi:MAG: hypothetical protein FK733_07320 [Asgard group archaeon]|nr:hypothetical protein [Asgard group archaeon]
MEWKKVNTFYKGSLVIALLSVIGYLFQEIIFIIKFWGWMTQSFFFVLVPISNFIAILSIITIFVTMSERYNSLMTRKIAIILMLLSGMVQIANYIFAPVIDESWGIHPGETFLSMYRMYDLNFIVLVIMGITILIPFIMLLINIRKGEEKTSEVMAFIPLLIMVMVFDILCKHITRDIFYFGLVGKNGYSFVSRLAETIFIGIFILLLIIDRVIKDEEIAWVGKKILICAYFIVMSVTTSINTIIYVSVPFYLLYTIGNICLYVGSVLLIIASILVIVNIRKRPTVIKRKEKKSLEKRDDEEEIITSQAEKEQTNLL